MDIVWQVVLLVGGAVLGVVFARLGDKWFSPLGEEVWADYSAVPLSVGRAQALAPELTYRIGEQEIKQPYLTRLSFGGWERETSGLTPLATTSPSDLGCP